MTFNVFLYGIITLFLSACGGGGGDRGGSSVTSVVCIGDSITAGSRLSGGQAYPSQLSAMIGVPVINAGVPGQTSAGGVGRISSLIDNTKPSHICILYGSNDAIQDVAPTVTFINIVAMVNTAIAKGVVPVVGTIPPMIGERAIFQPRVNQLNDGIPGVVSDNGGKVADSAGPFGSDGSGLLQSDNLHPNASGAIAIATAFANQL